MSYNKILAQPPSSHNMTIIKTCKLRTGRYRNQDKKMIHVKHVHIKHAFHDYYYTHEIYIHYTMKHG